MKKSLFIMALLIPIGLLLSNVIHKQVQLSYGKTVSLSVQGFDPRDLLSGHYLVYDVLYNSDDSCADLKPSPQQKLAMCLSPHHILSPLDDLSPRCDVFLQGHCDCHRDRGCFKAGIERFYIPDDHALELDKAMRTKGGELVISVNRKGEAAIKELMIDGKSWREYVQRP